jgi:hypothetical protein
MKKTTNPSNELLRSIKNTTHAGDLAAQLSEVTLDSFLTEGVLKDIPVIGSALSLFKAGNAIAGFYFAKKILAFLSEVEKAPKDKRQEFIEKECSDAKSIEHVGEATLMLLDKADTMHCARMLGKAFALMANGDISRPQFDSYSNVIRNLDTYLISEIIGIYGVPSRENISPSAVNQLANLGLIEIAMWVNPEVRRIMNKTKEQTAFGGDFFQHILKPTTEEA